MTNKDPCFFLIIIKGSPFSLLLMSLFVAGYLLILVLRLFIVAESKGLIRNIKKSPPMYPLWHQESLKVTSPFLQHQGIFLLYCWAKYFESGISLWFLLLCLVFNVCSVPYLPRFNCLVSNFVSNPFWFLWLEKSSWNKEIHYFFMINVRKIIKVGKNDKQRCIFFSYYNWS